MGLANRVTACLLFTGTAVVATAPAVFAQQAAGVVTSLEGSATVSRVALPAPRVLQFKDDVYVHDRITTGERSLVRVLLGGKATVTARERSVLTITETPGVSTVTLDEGRIAVAVSKGLMKPGEIVEIKTPNAVSAIRGTVVVAEVVPGATVRSTITVLRGLVDVTRLEAGHRVGPKVDVGALQALTVAGTNPLTRPNAVGADAAKRLTSEFRVIPQGPPTAAAAPAVEVAMRHAKAEAESIAPPRRGAEKANGAAAGKGKVRGSDSSSAASALYSGSDLVPLSASVGGTAGSDGATATIANSTPVVPLSTPVTGSTVGVGSALDATSLAVSKKNAKK